MDKNILELEKQTPASVISVQREYQLNLDIIDPKTLDELYATVPEVSRIIDLRGSAIIYRGYEVQARDDSAEAKKFANICSFILEKSGGVNFVEQWQKNSDLYGNGYVELIENNGKIDELAHVHAQNFGYEIEEVYDETTFSYKSKIKLDKDTQKPVGYATYKFDENKQIWVNDKKIPIESIAHLRYKLIGDGLYGISLIQPMYGSILRKLKLENSIDVAGRLVAAPKIVIKGNFATDEEAKEQAREAANLDVNDVVILQNAEDFQMVNPGPISLPAMREVFVVNITTASGVPRPILTSESSEINKATMQELMKQLRENMRSNMEKMRNIMERQIFYRIGESYNISNFEKLIPYFFFPEDVETEEEIIVREEKKAATLTSLANSLMLINNMMMGSSSTAANTEMKEELAQAMRDTFKTYTQTIKTFNVNNDQHPDKKEEELPEQTELTLDFLPEERDIPTKEIYEENEINIEETEMMIQETLIDEIDTIKQPQILQKRHEDIHYLFNLVINGAEIWDIQSGRLITLPAIIKKHDQYLNLMDELGMVHEFSEIGKQLDQII